MRKIVSIIVVSLAVLGAQPVKCQSISLEKAKEMTLVNNHIIKQSQLDAIKAGEMPVTVILQDPLGNSVLVSGKAQKTAFVPDEPDACTE